MNLDRPVLMCVWADGRISFREKGTINPDFPHALPFHSVDTVEEARTIQLTHCRLQYDNVNYVLNDWSGNPEDIFTLAETLGLS